MEYTALNDTLYIRFRELLLSRSGLHYPERKRADLLHGLQMAQRVLGAADLAALYDTIIEDSKAWDLLIEHLTIGETYFFRNGPQFEALRNEIIPELLVRRSSIRSIRCWSAGCATGEEPYSLAITLNALLPDDQWQYSILATDLNRAFLARAREAVYGSWSFRETTDEQRARFFTEDQGRWRLLSEIRRRVLFARLNLAEPCYPSVTTNTSALDIILCRNVLIYFDETTTRQVIERLYAALSPGGWLIVGHAEPDAELFARFETHNMPGTVIYRKPLDAPMFASDPGNSIVSTAPNPMLPARPRQSPYRPQTAPLRERLTSQTAPLRERPQTAPLRERPGTAPLRERPQTGPLREPPTPAARWALITVRLASGNRIGLEPLIHDLLRDAPEHAEGLAALGRICADRGDWAEARGYCEQALRHDQLCAAAHYTLAQVQEYLGELEAALASYRRTSYLDYRFVAGIIGMANVWRQLGELSAARRAYRNALKLLQGLEPASYVDGFDHTTAAELIPVITSQLEALEQGVMSSGLR